MSTKSESYKTVDKYLQQNQILDIIKNAEEPLSRSKLSNISNFRLSSVCGRVKELIEDNKIKVIGYAVDEDTGKTVQLLGVTDTRKAAA